MRLLATLLLFALAVSFAPAADFVEVPAETLRDKVRGGLLGQILGNLNGLPHENKYIDEPGNVTSYTPALPKGAWTDDDTDFEWVYIVAMQRENQILLPSARIAELWRQRINRRIWCSNRYARHLMDLGLEPPETGRAALNPWADFNISGQFLSETFALMAPAMPKTAARIGLNYTRVAIDLEPAQTTQFFTSMIATAFVESDIGRILDAGVRSLDPNSHLHLITNDVRRWRRQNPSDWRTTRRLIKEKYTQDGGAMRDRNGYELNTASAVAALLYGEGDFAKTLMSAFNFGWDCDNTAATTGTIVGVTKGYRWMMAQGWQIVDRYENRTRDNMPMDETITSFADRVLDLSERVITGQGGQRLIRDGSPVFRIASEKPASIVSLPSPEQQLATLRSERKAEIESGISSSDPQTRARAAYMAIALDLWQPIRSRHPEQWQQSLDSLTSYWKIMQNIFFQTNTPLGNPLRERAIAAGLSKPAEQRPVW